MELFRRLFRRFRVKEKPDIKLLLDGLGSDEARARAVFEVRGKIEVPEDYANRAMANYERVGEFLIASAIAYHAGIFDKARDYALKGGDINRAVMITGEMTGTTSSDDIRKLQRQNEGLRGLAEHLGAGDDLIDLRNVNPDYDVNMPLALKIADAEGWYETELALVEKERGDHRAKELLRSAASIGTIIRDNVTMRITPRSRNLNYVLEVYRECEKLRLFQDAGDLLSLFGLLLKYKGELDHPEARAVTNYEKAGNYRQAEIAASTPELASRKTVNHELEELVKQ